MQLFSDGDEILTKSSLASIMGNMPVTVNLSAKATWSNSSYTVYWPTKYHMLGANYPNRLTAYTIVLPNCQEINVKIDLVSKGQWHYVLLKNLEDNTPDNCFGDTDWRNTTTETIQVPDGAKYMCIELRLSDDTNIYQTSGVATSIQFLTQTTLGSFLLAGSGEITEFN